MIEVRDPLLIRIDVYIFYMTYNGKSTRHVNVTCVARESTTWRMTAQSAITALLQQETEGS